MAEQKVKEKIGIVKQGAIPKAANAKLKREIGAQLSEMRLAAGFDLFPETVQKNLKKRAARLDTMIDSLSSMGARTNTDILSSLPTAKQNIYREVFALIYECAVNKVVAKLLVDKILQRLSKSN